MTHRLVIYSCYRDFVSGNNWYNMYLINVSTQWSFGVTVWELFTCGSVPYSGDPVRNVLRALKAGQRLEKPENTACSEEMLVT